MAHDLTERRGDVASRLEDLQRKRGATLLDTGKLPAELGSAVAGAESELDAIDEALAEDTRRRREADAAAVAARLAELRGRLAAAESERLDAIERSEMAARALGDGLRDTLTATRAINQVLAASGARRPAALEISAIKKRLSGRLSVILKAVDPTCGDRFGDMSLRPPPFAKGPPDDWRAAEAREGAQSLAQYLNPRKEKAP